jgi:hypothetical protein
MNSDTRCCCWLNKVPFNSQESFGVASNKWDVDHFLFVIRALSCKIQVGDQLALELTGWTLNPDTETFASLVVAAVHFALLQRAPWYFIEATLQDRAHVQFSVIKVAVWLEIDAVSNTGAVKGALATT